jgi:predicted MPP superfamily phosphohydrolase
MEFYKIINIVITILCFLYLYRSIQITINFLSTEPITNSKLKFNLNENGIGEFTILQLTDLHYGESEDNDIKTTKLMAKLIKQTNPDLIVITGDAVSGYAWNKIASTYYQDNWNKWTQSINESKKPYAYVLGNHDAQANLSRKEVIELDKTNPYSYMSLVKKGVYKSNYNIPLYSSDGMEKKGFLWFLDTMSENCMGEPNSWGCFEELDWYDLESERIAHELGRTPKGLAFFHIPIPEYLEMHNNGFSYNTRNEDINCPKKNNYLFARFMKQGNIKGMFCGHDHDNDEGGYYLGFEFVYGRKTGYGGYGPKFFQRGARVIKLSENDKGFDYDHYILQEDGTVVKKGELRQKGLTDFVKECVI